MFTGFHGAHVLLGGTALGIVLLNRKLLSAVSCVELELAA